ncbi:MAG TPA: J domain-containing protein [Pyrinomonadaceae bacterium]
MRTFTVGQIIYHGWRYWKSEDLEAGEVLGWNTLYLPYRVTKITAARIHVEHKETRIQLNRSTMEAKGKQYHTRFHEYFYAEKPEPESKDWNWAGSKLAWGMPAFDADALTVLGLSPPFTRDDVRRAYKRRAKTAHPDLGGTQQAFIKLKQAHDSALRFATG